MHETNLNHKQSLFDVTVDKNFHMNQMKPHFLINFYFFFVEFLAVFHKISFQSHQRDETTSTTQQASSLTNMFDPHIYACQSLVGSNSNPTIQSLAQGDAQQKNQQSPTGSPQKNKHVNSNTVIPIQTTGTLTPQRKQSQQEEGHDYTENVMTSQLIQNSGSSSNSATNSRKTSTVSDNTPSSDLTPENTILTPKDVEHLQPLPQQQLSATPTTALDPHQVKASPVRKLSRFLVSPTVIETANHELIVQEGSQAPASSPQQSEAQQPIDLNINEENYQRAEAPETELQPQQSIGFRMPETLEQLKIELENITHAHVSTKAKEALSAQQALLQGIANQEADDSHEPVSEAQVESSAAEYPSIDAITTSDNTSVYNSRRTSADMNTNPTDLTSTASGVGIEYEENLVSEPIQMATEEAGPKMTQQLSKQMSIDRFVEKLVE
jgi:hypothetical protein